MNSQINYGDLIKEAWQIAWKNKYLWWFGLLVSLSSGVGSNFSSSNWQEKNDWTEGTKQKIYDWAVMHPEWIIGSLILLVLLMIVFLALNVWGRGALIVSLGKVVAKNKEQVNFKAGMKESKKFFWSILGLNLFLFGTSVAALIILSTPVAVLFYLKAYWAGFLLAFFGVVFFIILVILFSYLQRFGVIYLVLGKISLWNALENAYRLFRRNLLPSIIVGAIFIPLGFLVGLAALGFIFVSLLIFLIPGALAYFLLGKLTVIILAVLGSLILIAGILTINSIYAVFAQTLWILFFRQIALPKEEERVTEIAVELKPAEVTEVPA